MDLIACPDCKRQYDVTGHSVGERIRCLCERLLVVEKHAPHQPRILRCSGCGGHIKPGSTDCQYCHGSVALEDRNLTSVCPECFARIPGDSKFCVECGGGIRPQAIRAVPDGACCPRCEGQLQSRVLVEECVTECSDCGGVWVVPEVFERICQDATNRSAPRTAGTPTPKPKRTLERQQFRYLSCLVCDDKMVPRNFGKVSGIMIDVCREHGVWFDTHELEAIVDFLRRGGAARTAEFEKMAKPTVDYGRADASRSITGSAATNGIALTGIIEAAGDFFLGLFD